MAKGWSEERQAFVQAYGSKTLDASNLMMPLVFFVSPTDPRMQSTLDATLRDLVADSFVYRYDVDDTKDGPLHASSFSVAMMFFTQGKQYSFGELRDILEEAGFVDVGVTVTSGYFSLVSARKL